MADILFTPAKLGSLTLSNHIVMAPMTRSRAIGNVPNDLMATYYGQRATAGLIITEGTSPSPNGLGYARIPGIYSEEQVEGWKKITTAVHDKGGKIFVQLMHTGRIAHPANLPAGARVVAPSAVTAVGQMYTDAEGMQPHPQPHALTASELIATKQEYVQAAQNAIAAGFDGVELHGANGYLLEQFLHPVANQRTDNYGGSIENRARFVLEVAAEVATAIGADKVGIRLSPYGVNGDMPPYSDIHNTYFYLAGELHLLNLVYLHLVDHSGMGAPVVPPAMVEAIRKTFSGTLILSGSYNAARAEEVLENGMADLVAFGRPFIANPDLVERMKAGATLAEVDMGRLYTPGEVGYTDYPTLG